MEKQTKTMLVQDIKILLCLLDLKASAAQDLLGAELTL